MSFDWKSLTPDELEKNFNPRAVPQNQGNFDEIYAEKSAAAKAALRHETDIRYGDGERMLLDIFPADDPSAPVLIYIHGGYWRARVKEQFSFVAGSFTPQGITTVIMDYDLCPKVTVDHIVSEAVDGVEWIARNIAKHGGNPDKLFIAGHSAGAHLAAMALGADWEGRGLSNDILKGATLMTGIYDPEPSMHISVNNDLHLTPESVAICNALETKPVTDCPLLITVGGDEPEGWIDQSRQYHERHGGELIISEGDGHLSLLLHHCDTSSNLFKAHLAQIKG